MGNLVHVDGDNDQVDITNPKPQLEMSEEERKEFLRALVATGLPVYAPLKNHLDLETKTNGGCEIIPFPRNKAPDQIDLICAQLSPEEKWELVRQVEERYGLLFRFFHKLYRQQVH